MGSHHHVSSHWAALGWWSGSNEDKYEAASAAIAAFKGSDIDSCVFGSLACKLVGVACKPNDVDLIVLDTESTLEEHKEFLVKENDQFYLLPSRKPNAPCRYRVLWYKTTRGSRVKIDVLQPGVMSVPDFMPSDIIWEPVPRHRLKIPMAPLGIVLLLKLLGWDEHRLSNIKRYNIKRYADADHIRGLLKLGLELVDYDYLPPEFLWKAQKRVYTFVYRYPHTKLLWHNLGFRVRRPLNYNRR